nr:hypothetical protein [Chromobacterium sp. ASV5]
MTMISCDACGAKISKKAEKCPQCGHPNKKANQLSTWKALGSLVLAGGVFFWLFGGGLERSAKKETANIYNQVAEDAVNQYDIAKRQGDKIQICVQAGFVVAAYLQAKDETNYQQWKDIQQRDCEHAGMPSS